MSMQRIPNFRGRRALVLHRPDRNREAVVAQLERLGLFAAVRWPAEGVGEEDADVVLFDADVGFDGLFAWPRGAAPVPLVAVIGSEAPGRLEWMLAQEPCAYLSKPVGSTGVFSALAIAFHAFAARRAQLERLRQAEERGEAQGAVLAAAATLMQRFRMDARTAVRTLRLESMRRRMPLAMLSALVIDGKWLPGPEAPNQERGRRKTGSA